MSVRIGKVSYINAVPLFCAETPKDFEITPLVPSKLNALAETADFDVSLISRWVFPNVEKNYRVIPEFCIAGDGEVMSVKIFSKYPFEKLGDKKIFITEETGTSSKAFRFSAIKKFGVDIFSLVPADIDTADAALLIGNKALAFDASAYPYVYDLGDIWKETMEIPLIYAVFIVRNDVSPETEKQITDYLKKSLSTFDANKDSLCANAQKMFFESCEKEISAADIKRYYSKLIYRLPAGQFEKSFNFVIENGFI